MNSAAAADRAAAILRGYAGRTGLAPASGTPTRYLWTTRSRSARTSGSTRRPANPPVAPARSRWSSRSTPSSGAAGARRRTGWIGNLPSEGAIHRRPQVSGSADRSPNAGPSNRSTTGSMDRDGQYYHYLTKWTHALCRASRVTGDPVYGVWAAES